MSSTKERIIKEAVTLFAKQGCKVITMDDIATAMGISKRTIYENFSDKKDLLFQCMKYFFKEGQDNVNVILKSSENIIDTIFKTMQCNSAFVGRTKFNFFNEMHKYFPDVYNATVTLYKQYHFENTEKMLTKGKDEGVFRKDIDIKLMTTILHETTSFMLNTDVFSNYGYEKEFIMPVFMYNFTRGICTEKGLKIIADIEKSEKLKTRI
jgi:AcrR family transcriptional regulator